MELRCVSQHFSKKRKFNFEKKDPLFNCLLMPEGMMMRYMHKIEKKN